MNRKLKLTSIAVNIESSYGTARFKLDRKSRVVMRAHAMRVISLAFSSASTRKFTCTKNTRG